MDPSDGGTGRQPVLLIVDDEPVNLAVLAGLLRPRYRVRAANGGEAALRAASTDPLPELILLDVMMPGLDGHAVLSRLKEDPRTRDIPVIFVTALGAEEDEERGLRLGAVDFITKPIRPSVVRARVHTHLELKESRDRLRSQNSWLEAEVDRRTRENVLIQDVSLSVIAGLVETRDAGTGDHTMRTRSYVETLALRLARDPSLAPTLHPDAVSLMVKAAPLHDIGKVGIPDAILLKPGPLTHDEFAVMKTHARIGGEAIAHALERAGAQRGEDGHTPRSLAFLETAREMALWHHERWDGHGYPDAVAGASTPLCARVMGVADVFDALTTRRPYKAPMPTASAVDFIVAGRGSQFDASVVDALVAVREEFGAIVERYAVEPAP